MARGGTTDLFGQLDQLGELVVCLCAELGILLRKVLHELRVAGRDLGAQLGVPVHTKVNLVNQKNLKLFNVNCVYIFFFRPIFYSQDPDPHLNPGALKRMPAGPRDITELIKNGRQQLTLSDDCTVP